jgi:ABC-type phosphate transport system permease subunit
MGIPQKMRFGFISVSLLLLAVSLFFLLVVFLPWYAALGVITMGIAASPFIWKRQSLDARRILSENLFVIVSGATALIIVVFVVYFLVHIFLLGQSQLSWSFLVEAPAEGLTEGGIFPAIVGTAMLVIIMSLAAVPIGTVTAIYLTEYANTTSITARFIRFAVNTLAGVPAIVFGLFGLGFFIGALGTRMDTMEFKSRMNDFDNIVTVGASPFADDGKATVSEIAQMLETDDAEGWSAQIEKLRILKEIKGDAPVPAKAVREFFTQQKRPHWGQPSILWAALTMALLTLPVVIVSVEEAIKSVPKELREASLALGATKWKTIRSIVIPGSMAGIFTGAILAVSRGAGEVAPILFTGAAYYLPELPSGLSSQFMELGYHIYVLTTQSTNVEATKPLLYATTFVLLMLTFTLNFTAIFLRSRVRARMSRLS